MSDLLIWGGAQLVEPRLHREGHGRSAPASGGVLSLVRAACHARTRFVLPPIIDNHFH